MKQLLTHEAASDASHQNSKPAMSVPTPRLVLEDRHA
jgi:hypothetical protein